jgi:class 3 adenylate cyclase/pimeloyl-ACP methyl ester carboxylesterase
LRREDGSNVMEVLARDRRLVTYDRRGTGDSRRDVSELGLKAQVSDVAAVADGLNLGRHDVTAYFDGCLVAIAYAAEHPERIGKLVLWYPFVDGANWIPPERVGSLISLAGTDWTLATRTLASICAPRSSGELHGAWAKSFRERLSPKIFVAYLQAMSEINVRDDARNVRGDTLLLCPRGAGLPTRFVQEVATLIPGAVLHIVDQNASFINDEHLPDIIRAFLDGDEQLPTPNARGGQDPGMAVIVFADIADSTALTERLGDAGFREKARELDVELRERVRVNGGSVIDAKTLGDGILATFAAASQAIAAALSFEEAASRVGLELHVGLHAGDVIREQDNVFGGAVNIAARISALAAAGEVLVSDVVRALARTSAGVAFEDRGEHALKGVADAQRVYAVRKAMG